MEVEEVTEDMIIRAADLRFVSEAARVIVYLHRHSKREGQAPPPQLDHFVILCACTLAIVWHNHHLPPPPPCIVLLNTHAVQFSFSGIRPFSHCIQVAITIMLDIDMVVG